jgi:hypothetical protein
VKSREMRVRPSWWFDIQAAETLLRAVLEARMNDPDERARQSAQTFKNLLEESPQGWGA